MIIEACCETIEEALCAEINGATRIEYCSNLIEEGLSPKRSDVITLLSKITVPVRIMVRPSNTFQPSAQEIELIISTLQQYNNIAIDGFVLGFLNEHKSVDFMLLQKILSHVGKKKITFHKAIDNSTSMFEDVEKLNNFSLVDTILTSGGAENAYLGKDNIILMQKLFDRTIMAAGKITKENLHSHQNSLNLHAYHGRKIV